MNRKYATGAESDFLTAEAVEALKKELERLTAQRPRAVEDLSRAREMGDLSENAAYHEAKGRLGKIDGLIFALKEQLKRAVIIEPGAGPGGRARLGSTVVVKVGGKEKSYQLVGPQETDPAKGRISHVSPLGSILMDRQAGDKAVLKTAERETVYEIIRVS